MRVAVGLGVVVDPRGAAVARADDAAELDADREPVGIGGVKRDRAHVMGPRARRVRPARFAGHVAQGGQPLPAVTAVLGAVQVARLGAGVDDRDARLLVGGETATDSTRRSSRPSSSVVQVTPAVVAGVHAAVERADVDAIRIAGVDREAPRPDAAKQRLRVAGLRAVKREGHDVIAGQGVDASQLRHGRRFAGAEAARARRAPTARS